MSAIIVDGDLVHYEVIGRGKPIVLLHGWLGSWRYWLPTMQQLGVKYRCYALDLWGFGDSGKDPVRYSFERQVDLLERFIERMGFPKAILVGHGLGAAIAARYAADHRTAPRVHRLFITAPPLFYSAPSTVAGAMALTANTANRSAVAETLPHPLSDSQVNMPPITRTELQGASMTAANEVKNIFENATLEMLLSRIVDSTDPDYEKLKSQVAKTDPQAVLSSSEAFAQVSTFRDILAIEVPTLVLLGEQDALLPVPDEALLPQLSERPDLKLVLLGTRHFPMIEDKSQFIRLLKDFVEAVDVTKLEMKEEWVRRKR